MRISSGIYAAVSILLGLAAFVAAPDGSLASLPWAIAATVAASAIVHGVRRHRPQNARVWLYIAAAIASWGLVAILFPLLGLTSSTAGYHDADLLYLPGYLGITLATLALVRGMGPLRLAGLDAAIGSLTLSTVLWSFVIEPNLQAQRGKLAFLVTLFPLCDVALLILVLRLLFSGSARLAAARLLAAATALLVFADVGYFSPVVAQGVLAGRVLAAGYALAYLLFGAAALHGSMRLVPTVTAEDVAPKRLVAVLACAPLAMPIVGAVNQLVLGHSDAEELALIGVAIVVLVMIRIVGVLKHLDELRLRAEASEQKFRMVFDSAAIGISIGSDGAMTETNRALQEMLGRSGEELSAMHYAEATHPDDRSLALDASDDVMSGLRQSYTFEKRLLRRDGVPLWVSITLSRAHDGSFGISLIKDISAQKELEDELRQAQKMEAVGKLAGGIAHDFNNVLTAVSGCAALLMRELPEHDRRRSRVEVIAQSAARATDLTRQLLAFSRRQVLRLEPLDLADIVTRMQPMLERLLPPNIVVDYALEPDAVARIDGAQFEQVLLNLALNARDAMPDGGVLRIAVRRVDGAAELVVADSGVGMDEDASRHIFEPFFTTKPSGTGLGLSTVDGIVGQSGGTIETDSQPGAGTIFTIRLPLAGEPAHRPQPDTELQAEAMPGRVLLADDEELVRRVTAEMLSRSGYDVVQVATGEKALEVLGEQPFEILVTDVAMAGMDGATLAHRARELCPGLPVLFISGYPAEVLTGQRMIEPDAEVLTKPFTVGELAERIEHVRRAATQLAAA